MSEDKDNAWDDSLLIKAYDESVNLTRETLAHRIADSTNRRGESEAHEDNNDQNKQQGQLLDEDQPFKVGDFARATYTDGLDYEGTIVSIDEGAATCVLRYVGYENEQEIPIAELLPSWGKQARRDQVEQSTVVEEKQQQAQQRVKSCKKTVAKGKPLSGARSSGLAMPPMPLLPPMFSPGGGMDAEPDQDFVAMLTAWYMSGYYTGLYQGRKESSAKKKTSAKK